MLNTDFNSLNGDNQNLSTISIKDSVNKKFGVSLGLLLKTEEKTSPPLNRSRIKTVSSFSQDFSCSGLENSKAPSHDSSFEKSSLKSTSSISIFDRIAELINKIIRNIRYVWDMFWH